MHTRLVRVWAGEISRSVYTAIGATTGWRSGDQRGSTAGDVKKLGPIDLSVSLGPEWIF